MMNKKIWIKAAAICLAFCLLAVPAAADYGTIALGGMPFGVKFYAEGVVVIGFSEVETEDGVRSPAYEAGLRVNDVITHVDGHAIATARDFSDSLRGHAVEVTYRRDGSERRATLIPAQSSEDGRRLAGMWLRDTMAGIGTVTYILPESGDFAGLGHGICDAETGELIPMERGTVVDVTITGIRKGQPGIPGELKGSFLGKKTGALIGNTEWGVFGVFASCDPESCTPVEIGARDEIRPGRASIVCTLDENGPREYEICISDIDRKSRDNRSFTITVTDAELLEKTGGIVQGMSGSPILQNGKLVGAVTHVLVSDPGEGYGIFIENMLENMQSLFG